MRRRTNPDSEEHIRRIEARSATRGATRGFQVHFARGGRLWTKFFSDGKHGSKNKARLAARRYRDSLIPKLPPTQVSAPIRENATGYSLRTRKNRNGTITQYISASASTEEGSVRKAFRIVDDVATAAKAALDWRLEMAMKRVRQQKRQARGTGTVPAKSPKSRKPAPKKSKSVVRRKARRNAR